MKVLIFIIILLTSLDVRSLGKSQTLEVIASGGGGGGGGLAIQVTLPPLPSPINELIFADQRLEIVYPVIQNFKNLITSDPLNITSSWVGADICKYKGFYCDNPPDNKSAIALASIDFNGFQLSSPTLVGFLDKLPDLALFHANSNNFSGIIPPDIAYLPYLYELDLSNNKFSGPFPSAVLAMDSLSFLDIRFNFFSGSVPQELFTKNLDVLFLNDNNFMTRLPDNIETSHVFYLTLANNKFFGPIPRSIAQTLFDSSEILLLNNMLSGCLPYELGLLKEAVVFDAGNNNLTGLIPLSLGCLEKLEVLNLAGNQLYGTVPEVLCALGNLVNLSLSDNYFTQTGPICMSLIEKGVLDARRNCIPGQAFQRSVAECAMFFARPRYCPYYVRRIPCSVPGMSSSPQLAPSPS
ncbi:hypothetical protein CDL12_01097 [Handroanthus impetiginosus]|uniref:Uncharacterized protein n=1 Tax=Handroanthus impetiginosus TaxID=429701 RepID=A0A2G9I8R3_9LAMI|nr:hypothetical protein CDL12_01097 [Handroanthus impetiginosus]